MQRLYLFSQNEMSALTGRALANQSVASLHGLTNFFVLSARLIPNQFGAGAGQPLAASPVSPDF